MTQTCGCFYKSISITTQTNSTPAQTSSVQIRNTGSLSYSRDCFTSATSIETQTNGTPTQTNSVLIRTLSTKTQTNHSSTQPRDTFFENHDRKAHHFLTHYLFFTVFHNYKIIAIFRQLLNTNTNIQERNHNETKNCKKRTLCGRPGSRQTLSLVRMRTECLATILRWFAQGNRVYSACIHSRRKQKSLSVRLQTIAKSTVLRWHTCKTA